MSISVMDNPAATSSLPRARGTHFGFLGRGLTTRGFSKHANLTTLFDFDEHTETSEQVPFRNAYRGTIT